MSDKSREAQDFDKPYGTAGVATAANPNGRPMPKNGERRAHQKAITQGLRKFFDSVAAEPVPDEFLDLLKKMDDGKGGGA
jgi:hypothetical protein